MQAEQLNDSRVGERKAAVYSFEPKLTNDYGQVMELLSDRSELIIRKVGHRFNLYFNFACNWDIAAFKLAMCGPICCATSCKLAFFAASTCNFACNDAKLSITVP